MLQASVLGRLPVNDKRSLVARLGMSHWESELYLSDGFSSALLEDDAYDINRGIAAEMRVTEQLNLRVEGDHTKIGS